MITIVSAYLLCGVLIGLLSGFFGIGGGIVGIPVLLQCFARQGMPQSLSMHMAIGTMLAIAAVTTLMAMRKHHKNEMILVPLCKQVIPFLVTGSLIGTTISSRVDAALLQRIFAVFLLFAAFRMIKSGRGDKSSGVGSSGVRSSGVGSSGDKSSGVRSSGDTGQSRSENTIGRGTTFGIGVLSGLLGLGGGILLVPYFHWKGIPLKNAIATATACIVPAAVIGAVSYMMMHVDAESSGTTLASTGYVYWPAFLGISVTGMVFAPLGAQLTEKASTPKLKAAFSILLMVIAVHLSK